MILQIIFYIILSIISLMGIITLIGLIGFFLIFRSCDKDRSDLTFNFNPSEKPVDIDSMEFKEQIINRLYEIHEQNGFFPTYVKAFLSGDKRWDIRAMWENFIREPDIRWQILFFAIPQIIFKPKNNQNYSQQIFSESLFKNKVYYPLITAFITEQLILFRIKKHVLADSFYNKIDFLIEKNITTLIDCQEEIMKKNGGIFKTISNPGSKNNILNKLIGGNKWSFLECDTTGVAFSLFNLFLSSCEKGLISSNTETIQKVNCTLESTAYASKVTEYCKEVKEYTIPKGRQLIRDDLKGFLTYFVPGMNDADPSINFDVLHALISNWQRWNLRGNIECIKKINAAIEYLYYLAEKDLLFSNLTYQYYYTLPSVAFLWSRLFYNFSKFDDLDRTMFDCKGYLPVIHQKALKHWENYLFEQTKNPTGNIFEYLLLFVAFPQFNFYIKPLIIKYIMKKKETQLGIEFFCGFYPLKVIYCNPILTLSMFLNV